MSAKNLVEARFGQRPLAAQWALRRAELGYLARSTSKQTLRPTQRFGAAPARRSSATAASARSGASFAEECCRSPCIAACPCGSRPGPPSCPQRSSCLWRPGSAFASSLPGQFKGALKSAHTHKASL